MSTPIIIHREQQDDGSYKTRAEQFPDEAKFSPSALYASDGLIRTFIEINAANGRAVYEVVSGNDDQCYITAKKITER